MENISLLEKVIHGNYEELTTENAIKSLNVITKIYPIYGNSIGSLDDVFLYCSALNFLNAYVKVDTKKAITVFQNFYKEHPEIEEYITNLAKINHHQVNFRPYTKCQTKEDIYKCFKNLAKSIMNKILNSEELKKDIKMSVSIDKGMTLGMIEVYGVQFSFHKIRIYDNDVELKAILDDKSKWIEWRGVRLQPLATHVFDLAQDQENLSEINKNALKGLKSPCISQENTL